MLICAEFFAKEMKKRTTCSWVECIYFYKKCKAAGMTAYLKLSDNDREILKKCAEGNIYFTKIEREELFKIYQKGMKICDKKKINSDKIWTAQLCAIRTNWGGPKNCKGLNYAFVSFLGVLFRSIYCL